MFNFNLESRLLHRTTLKYRYFFLLLLTLSIYGAGLHALKVVLRLNKYPNWTEHQSEIKAGAGIHFKSSLKKEELFNLICYIEPFYRFINEKMFPLPLPEDNYEINIFNNNEDYHKILKIPWSPSPSFYLFEFFGDNFGFNKYDYGDISYKSIAFNSTTRVYLSLTYGGYEKLFRILTNFILKRDGFPETSFPWFKEGMSAFCEFVLGHRKGKKVNLAFGLYSYSRIVALLGNHANSPKRLEFEKMHLSGMFNNYRPQEDNDLAWAFFVYMFENGYVRECYKVLQQKRSSSAKIFVPLIFKRDIDSLNKDFKKFVLAMPAKKEKLFLVKSLLMNDRAFTHFQKKLKGKIIMLSDKYQAVLK
ncbi:hypothetical protein ACFL35_07155 [Candidatus Riflebacteria bacterium]